MYWKAGKFIFDLASIEVEYRKGANESDQDWMKRIHLKLVSVFGDKKEIDIIRNIKSIELLTDFLLRKIIQLAERDNSVTFAAQAKEIHQTYKEAFDHTNAWFLKVNDLINHPGKQADSRISIFMAFKFAHHCIMMYAAMGRFYDMDEVTDELAEEIGRRVEEISSLPKGKYKYVYVRPDDNKELEAFNNVESVSLAELMQDKNCGEEAPKLYKGKVINCTRTKGHDGAHVVMSSFLGMGKSADCAWEEY